MNSVAEIGFRQDSRNWFASCVESLAFTIGKLNLIFDLFSVSSSVLGSLVSLFCPCFSIILIIFNDLGIFSVPFRIVEMCVGLNKVVDREVILAIVETCPTTDYLFKFDH